MTSEQFIIRACMLGCTVEGPLRLLYCQSGQITSPVLNGTLSDSLWTTAWVDQILDLDPNKSHTREEMLDVIERLVAKLQGSK